MFNFSVGKAINLIYRNLFYTCSTFKVNVNDMFNGNVKLLEHGDNEEYVKQTECF